MNSNENLVILEQSERLDGTIAQTVRDEYGNEFERTVSAQEAFGVQDLTFSESDYILIADALDILDPLDDDGEEDGAKAERCAQLAEHFRALAEKKNA